MILTYKIAKYLLLTLLIASCKIANHNTQQSIKVKCNNYEVNLGVWQDAQELRPNAPLIKNENSSGEKIFGYENCKSAFVYRTLRDDTLEFFTFCDSLLYEYEQLFQIQNNNLNVEVGDSILKIDLNYLKLDDTLKIKLPSIMVSVCKLYSDSKLSCSMIAKFY